VVDERLQVGLERLLPLCCDCVVVPKRFPWKSRQGYITDWLFGVKLMELVVSPVDHPFVGSQYLDLNFIDLVRRKGGLVPERGWKMEEE